MVLCNTISKHVLTNTCLFECKYLWPRGHSPVRSSIRLLRNAFGGTRGAFCVSCWRVEILLSCCAEVAPLECCLSRYQRRSLQRHDGVWQIHIFSWKVFRCCSAQRSVRTQTELELVTPWCFREENDTNSQGKTAGKMMQIRLGE